MFLRHVGIFLRELPRREKGLNNFCGLKLLFLKYNFKIPMFLVSFLSVFIFSILPQDCRAAQAWASPHSAPPGGSRGAPARRLCRGRGLVVQGSLPMLEARGREGRRCPAETHDEGLPRGQARPGLWSGRWGGCCPGRLRRLQPLKFTGRFREGVAHSPIFSLQLCEGPLAPLPKQVLPCTCSQRCPTVHSG